MPTDLQALFRKCPNPARDEVVGLFPVTKNGGQNATSRTGKERGGVTWGGKEVGEPMRYAGDSGSAARFFYCAKASAHERRNAAGHITQKPLSLMRWLVRLVTPPGGTVCDPFAGSGTTGVAAVAEGFGFIGVEIDETYSRAASLRVRLAQRQVRKQGAG